MTGPADDGLFERLYDDACGVERGTGVELYERRGRSLEVAEGEGGVRVTQTEERGLALRLFRTGRSAFAASGPEEATGLVSSAGALLPRARARRGSRPPAPLASEPADLLSGGEQLREEGALEALAGFRQSLTAAGKGAVVVREATVLAGTRRERIATSAGRRAAWTTSAASLAATVVGRLGSERFSSRVVASAPRVADLPLPRLARLASDRVLLPLTGRRLTPGRYDVLLDPLVAASLVARLAPLFFGDAEEERIAARTRGGRDAFASPLVTLVDAASVPAGAVSSVRDGEGTPQGRTVVVDKGRVAGRLTDVAASARLGAPPTGNAVRVSWASPPEIGVTNFFLDPAPGVSPLDLLSAAAKGVYAAVLLERPAVDLGADTFRLAAAGYALEKGRAASRVSEVVVGGRLSDFLRAVAAIGDDLKFAVTPGGGAGAPTLLVPRWKID